MGQVVIHHQERACGACNKPVAIEVHIPEGAQLDPKALTVRDVRCALHLSEAKFEELKENPRERETMATAGRCQVCQEKIAIFVSLPVGCTATIDSMRMLHAACAVPGGKRAA